MQPFPTPMMLKFDQDWPTGFRDIQNEKCEIFITQGQVTPMRAFMSVLVSSNFYDDSIKNERASMETAFSHFPKTICSLSPTPVMLHIKFDQDWPNGFSDIQFESVDDNDGQTIGIL